MTDDMLTPRQVADELGVTVRTVQRWVADGRLPASRVGGRVRVSRVSLGAVTASPTTLPPRPIRSLLIANRGEIVVRIARTAEALGIRTIGVHAPDDRPPDGVDLALPISDYLDADAILDAARRGGADAIHPGYGFLSENPAFADAVQRAGLIWVGPPGTPSPPWATRLQPVGSRLRTACRWFQALTGRRRTTRRWLRRRGGSGFQS